MKRSEVNEPASYDMENYGETLREDWMDGWMGMEVYVWYFVGMYIEILRY